MCVIHHSKFLLKFCTDACDLILFSLLSKNTFRYCFCPSSRKWSWCWCFLLCACVCVCVFSYSLLCFCLTAFFVAMPPQLALFFSPSMASVCLTTFFVAMPTQLALVISPSMPLPCPCLSSPDHVCTCASQVSCHGHQSLSTITQWYPHFIPSYSIQICDGRRSGGNKGVCVCVCVGAS